MKKKQTGRATTKNPRFHFYQGIYIFSADHFCGAFSKAHLRFFKGIPKLFYFFSAPHLIPWHSDFFSADHQVFFVRVLVIVSVLGLLNNCFDYNFGWMWK